MSAPRRRTPQIGEAFPATLTAAQGGDGVAFEQLYRAFAPTVAGYLRLQGAGDPDDLTNEVFLGVFTSIGTFAGTEDQFRSWLFTIAHRRLTDDRRRRSRRPAIAEVAVEETMEPAGDVEDDALKVLGTDRVRSLADGLAPDQRDVVLLRMVGGLTIEQTADALGKSPTAIKALQRRAVGALRRLFEQQGVST